MYNFKIIYLYKTGRMIVFLKKNRIFEKKLNMKIPFYLREDNLVFRQGSLRNYFKDCICCVGEIHLAARVYRAFHFA